MLAVAGLLFNMVAYREEPEVWAQEGSTGFSKVVLKDALQSISRMQAGGGSSLLNCLQVQSTIMLFQAEVH